MPLITPATPNTGMATGWEEFPRINMNFQSHDFENFDGSQMVASHQDDDTNTDAFTPDRRAMKKSSFSFQHKKEAPLLEKLKSHPCKTEHVYNSKTKRMNKVIT